MESSPKGTWLNGEKQKVIKKKKEACIGLAGFHYFLKPAYLQEIKKWRTIHQISQQLS